MSVFKLEIVLNPDQHSIIVGFLIGLLGEIYWVLPNVNSLLIYLFFLKRICCACLYLYVENSQNLISAESHLSPCMFLKHRNIQHVFFKSDSWKILIHTLYTFGISQECVSTCFQN